MTGGAGTRGVYVGQIDGSQPRRLFDADAAAVYASSGQLLFVRRGTLFAQNFDPLRLTVSGDPFPVSEGVVAGALSASAAGPIVYRTGSTTRQRQFVWFDRLGKEIGKVGDPDDATPQDPSISPDGRSVAVRRTVSGNSDIWLLEIARGVLSRFTFDAGADGFPIWSRNGNRIAFSSTRGSSGSDLYEKPATGAESEKLLLATQEIENPSDWSPDGRFLLYRSSPPNMSIDIWATGTSRHS